MELKLEVMEREVIKPASPLLHDHIKLSILDLSCPEMYVSTIFFYKSDNLVNVSSEITSEKLKTSLSETLSRFYPLAGKLEGVSINCNNEGAVFTKARTNLLLQDYLRNLDTNTLEELRPIISSGDSPTEWPLLSVKVTFFGCGSGVAISVSVSHRICDASSLLTFVTEWAATTTKDMIGLEHKQVKLPIRTQTLAFENVGPALTKEKSNIVTSPEFAEATIYPPPPPNFPLKLPSTTDSIVTKKYVVKRFVFESSKIIELKRKVSSETVPLPTRVEAITSLIWKCARNASKSNLMVPTSTLMYQAMDLRLRIPSSVLSHDAIGNLQTAFFLKKDANIKLEVHETVVAFRNAKEEINEMIKENVQGNTLGESLLSVMGKFVSEYKPDIDIYTMSSWCGKPFYEVDFGWGSPVWMGSASHEIYDKMVYVVLMDSKDGVGVEAWISLLEQDMPVFVLDQDLLAYSVLNPPVMI